MAVYRIERNQNFGPGGVLLSEELVEVDITADVNRPIIEAAIVAALAELDALIAAPAVATVPAGTLTTAQLSTAMREMRDAVQANRAGAQKVAATLKRTIRLVRGDFDGID